MSKKLNRREKLLLSMLGISLSVLGYKYYESYHPGAYGEDPDALAYLKDKDPRSLIAGDLTHFKFGTDGFAEEAPNLPWKLSKMFDDGDGHFERPFRMAEENSIGSNADGLGPLYNAFSCETCHEADGRTVPDTTLGSLLIRLSVPGEDKHGGAKPHPLYGGQFAQLSTKDVPAEGNVAITYEEIEGSYGDGEKYSLRKPTYHFNNLGYGPLGDDFMFSPRTAPGVYGSGLLDAIADDTILAMADEEDQDGDGISGKANIVWDMNNQRIAVGKFGWKAEQASLLNQIADAAHNDMGAGNPIVPGDNCTDAQTACKDAMSGGDSPSQPHEFTRQQLEDMEVYLAFLGVPARGHLDDPKVLRGEALFRKGKCATCHKSNLITSSDHPLKRLRNQKISPYTDLLLHDMGEGLADNRPSFRANGQEWRTSPLWGIGFVETVNGHTNFLHDGRARGFEEAILWHGGEAEESKEFFRNLPKDDREALVAFLKSL